MRAASMSRRFRASITWREDAGGGDELRLDVAPSAPPDRAVDRDERAYLDERDEREERHDDAGLEAAEHHARSACPPGAEDPAAVAALAEWASGA